MELLYKQLKYFCNPTEMKILKIFIDRYHKQEGLSAKEIKSFLSKEGDLPNKEIDDSGIRKYLRKMEKHGLITLVSKGREKRYRINGVGIFHMVEASKVDIRIRRFRGPPKYHYEWNKDLAREHVKSLIEKIIEDAQKDGLNEVVNKVCEKVECWLRKMGLSEINLSTFYTLLNEAIYEIDPMLGFRSQIIGGNFVYWESYVEKIRDFNDNQQPIERRILTDVELRKLPNYVLEYFLDGKIYGHGMHHFSKFFSIVIDMRYYFNNGIKSPRYEASEPSNPTSVQDFFRKVAILSSKQVGGSVIFNNLNTIVAPYFGKTVDDALKNKIEKWAEYLIRDLQELYAILDPAIHCGLILNLYEKSPLDEERASIKGQDVGLYADYKEVADLLAKKFLDVCKKVNSPYPRIFLRVSEKTFEESSNIEVLKSILKRDNPIYFVNMNSERCKICPNLVPTAEEQFWSPKEKSRSSKMQVISGISTLISIILPRVKDDCELSQMVSNFITYEYEKRKRILDKAQEVLSSMGMSCANEDREMLEHFSLNIGVFGAREKLSPDSNTDEIYQYLNNLKGKIDVIKANLNEPLDIRYSIPPKKSRIYERYYYLKNGKSPEKGWTPPKEWMLMLNEFSNISERIRWEELFSKLFDGGYVPSFTLSEDEFKDYLVKILNTDIVCFKITLKDKPHANL